MVKSQLTFSERIDEAVLSAAKHKRVAAVAVFTLFGAVCLLAVARLAFSLSSGSATGSVGALLLLGLVVAPLLLAGCVAVGKAPGRVFWASLLLGDILIATGPALVLVADGWSAEVYTPGRWSGQNNELSSIAAVMWVLAVLMIVPGALGLWKSRSAQILSLKHRSKLLHSETSEDQ